MDLLRPEKREDIAATPARSPTRRQHFCNTTRAVFRILAASLTMALGGLLGTFGIVCFSIAWDFPTGTTADFYWVRIEVGGSTVSLQSWQIYASAAIAFIMAIALIALGFSFFPRRKGENDQNR